MSCVSVCLSAVSIFTTTSWILTLWDGYMCRVSKTLNDLFISLINTYTDYHENLYKSWEQSVLRFGNSRCWSKWPLTTATNSLSLVRSLVVFSLTHQFTTSFSKLPFTEEKMSKNDMLNEKLVFYLPYFSFCLIMTPILENAPMYSENDRFLHPNLLHLL